MPARVLEIGPDGRNVYTTDKAARGGKRSATNSRRAGLYVGREVHLGVAVSALGHTNTATQVTLGPPVPLVALLVQPVPAGTHPGDAVLDAIFEAEGAGYCADLVADPNYTLKIAKFLLPIQQAGIPLTMKIASWQRGMRGAIGGEPVIDGHVFSRFTPPELLDLRTAPRNASAAEREESARPFNRRANFRWGVHKRPTGDGIGRLMCPFHARRLRSRRLGFTMRSPKSAELVKTVPAGEKCCEGILSVAAGSLPFLQPCLFGTTAWQIAYGRQNRVETYNGFLHGGFIEIDKGYVQLGDDARIDVALAHGIAGVNRWQVKQFMRMHRLLDPSDPDALPPLVNRRRPRKTRLARYPTASVKVRPPPS